MISNLAKSLIILLFLISNSHASEVSFHGKFVQGGIIIGHSSLAEKVFFDGRELQISNDGNFIFGFGRNHKKSSIIKLKFPNKTETYNVDIKKRLSSQKIVTYGLNSVANFSALNLKTLVDRYPNLDIKQDWPRILSLGEQQRLAFARLLLNSPRFAVLDEATSALDIDTEKKLYSLLKERELSLISVGHRPSLKDFHENILELNGQGDWKLLTSDKYNFKD